MEQAGEDVIVLSVGDPDFDTPSDIVEAAVSALRGGDTHYTIAGGAGPLADAIAADESARLGSAILPGEVVATLGAQNGLYTLFHCLLEPGDEAILLAPAYSMFPGVIGSCGARVVTVPLDQSRGFALDIDALVNAMTPDTRAVLANFPHNPSGAFPDVETTRALIDLCAERGCWLVSDEA